MGAEGVELHFKDGGKPEKLGGGGEIRKAEKEGFSRFNLVPDRPADLLEYPEFRHLRNPPVKVVLPFPVQFLKKGSGFPLVEAIKEDKKREGAFAMGEIRPEGLPDPVLGSEEIGEVVVDLVGDSEVAAKTAGRPGEFRGRMGQGGPEVAGEVKELRRLQVDDPSIGGQTWAAVALLKRLHDLAGADLAGRFGDLPADHGGGKAGGHLDSVREQGVAEQDRGIGPEPFGCSRAVAAEAGLIHDIVVDQGCQVDHLDDRRQLDEVIEALIRAMPAREEDERGPDPFASALQAIADKLADFRLELGDLGHQYAIEGGEVGLEIREESTQIFGAVGRLTCLVTGEHDGDRTNTRLGGICHTIVNFGRGKPNLLREP